MKSIKLSEAMSDTDKSTFIKGCVNSGMRETHCEQCGCYLLTRGLLDLCPPCREKQETCPCLECGIIGGHKTWCSHSRAYLFSTEYRITPLELAFIIQDPCGDAAIDLARETLKLIYNRDDTLCKTLTDELRQLNSRYQRNPT